MYVCLCHGFTDRDVRGAISGGCHSVAAVYRHLADRPQCGKCVPEVRGMLSEQRRANHGGGACAPCASVAQAESQA
ncbi:MAG TPA: (2Fe-2S)-binding protein [Ferrovibrio sp.]|uniref:(2Fe-2S)-binding protein n=1 Tax=Ferrovibrio sp. TaxID=1917215 RepID=UPI002B4AC1F1|nr:(2Fe-2S)-binding protein [Ferrovibrio sp.]HLT78321.1 (2Fe-2S)-binding protein [Ferrovibrio sp.]